MDNGEQLIHVFELSGLGKAPFTFVEVYEKRGPLNMGNGISVGSPGQPMGTCAHCGTPIAECCVIRDANGKHFEVGNICVGKTGDKGLVDRVKRAVNARKREKLWAKQDAIIAEGISLLPLAKAKLESMEHPCIKGKTRYDWAIWMFKNAGRNGKINVAEQIIAMTKGVK